MCAHGAQDPDPAEMLAILGNTKRVNYYFIKCNDSTNKMISKLRQAHASSRKDFQEYMLGVLRRRELDASTPTHSTVHAAHTARPIHGPPGCRPRLTPYRPCT